MNCKGFTWASHGFTHFSHLGGRGVHHVEAPSTESVPLCIEARTSQRSQREIGHLPIPGERMSIVGGSAVLLCTAWIRVGASQTSVLGTRPSAPLISHQKKKSKQAALSSKRQHIDGSNWSKELVRSSSIWEFLVAVSCCSLPKWKSTTSNTTKYPGPSSHQQGCVQAFSLSR